MDNQNTNVGQEFWVEEVVLILVLMDNQNTTTQYKGNYVRVGS